MNQSFSSITRHARKACLCIALLSAGILTGCANFYVSNKLEHVEHEKISKPATPQPVQLFFQFETEDELNLVVTNSLYTKVQEEVVQSGLFSEVKSIGDKETPALQISINNFALNSAKARGFLVGVTFGVAGSTVGDGFMCKLKYVKRGDTAPVEAATQHAIFTSLGLIHGRPVAKQVSTAAIAEDLMTRQCVKKLLLDLAKTPEFAAAP